MYVFNIEKYDDFFHYFFFFLLELRNERAWVCWKKFEKKNYQNCELGVCFQLGFNFEHTLYLNNEFNNCDFDELFFSSFCRKKPENFVIQDQN